MMKPSVGGSSPQEGLSASVQVLPLPTGLYLFSVKAAPAAERSTGQLSLPAMLVGLGPGVSSDQVEFVSGPGNGGTWLFAHGDMLIVKVKSASATLILTSVRSSIGEVLSIEVERLEARAQAAVAAPADGASLPDKLPLAAAQDAQASAARPSKPSTPADEAAPLPLQIKTHIRSRGDMNFADMPWAGRVAPGLWIESFSVAPLKQLGAHHIEYKGLTGTGFETPWLSDDQICGTKGMAVPLVGFAVRLKPGAEAAAYDCEYSGYYRSSVIVGPLRNGAPCRSTVANDPLEGIQIRIVKRAGPTVASTETAPRIEPQRPAATAPSFGRYRDASAAAVNGHSKPASAAKPSKRSKASEANGKPDRSTRSSHRAPSRVS
jgi:hypothetical protein